jgi:hypothetical protein
MIITTPKFRLWIGTTTRAMRQCNPPSRDERPPAFGLEDERTRRIPLQLAQHAQFVTRDRVNCVKKRVTQPFSLRWRNCAHEVYCERELEMLPLIET